MLGPLKPRHLDEPIAVSLEALIPPSNFYRHLEAKLDLSFVREWAKECYAERGRPSIDPVVFFKLQLVMFFEGIHSERKLVETASLNLAHRWYLGYALDEDLPDHSSLTRIRQRLGIDVFQRFFEQVVDLCQEAGLVWGRELYFDATKVEANAGIPSLVPASTTMPRLTSLISSRASWPKTMSNPQPRRPICRQVSFGCRPTLTSRAYSRRAITLGGSSRSGGWIRGVLPSVVTGAPVTFASAPLTQMPRRCGTRAPSASAITTTMSSMAASAASSWLRS
jgi:transposase